MLLSKVELPLRQGEVWSVQGIPLLLLQGVLTAACDMGAQVGFTNSVLTSES